MANFKRGAKELVKRRSCDECKNNRHSACAVEAEVEHMGFDAEEFYNPGYCECYENDHA